MHLKIVYLSFILAVAVAISRKLTDTAKPLLLPLCIPAVLTIESRADILQYLTDNSYGAVNPEAVIKAYDLLVPVYILLSAAIATRLVNYSVKANFRKERYTDIVTALIIIFMIVTNLLLSIQNLSKFYDSSYVYTPPVLYGVMILWASFTARHYIQVIKKRNR